MSGHNPIEAFLTNKLLDRLSVDQTNALSAAALSDQPFLTEAIMEPAGVARERWTDTRESLFDAGLLMPAGRARYLTHRSIDRQVLERMVPEDRARLQREVDRYQRAANTPFQVPMGMVMVKGKMMYV